MTNINIHFVIMFTVFCVTCSIFYLLRPSFLHIKQSNGVETLSTVLLISSSSCVSLVAGIIYILNEEKYSITGTPDTHNIIQDSNDVDMEFGVDMDVDYVDETFMNFDINSESIM